MHEEPPWVSLARLYFEGWAEPDERVIGPGMEGSVRLPLLYLREL